MKRTILSVLIAITVAFVGCGNCDDSGARVVNCEEGEREEDGSCVPDVDDDSDDDDENDSDGDGVPDDQDNCPETPNPDQLDTDGDGIGDACDDCPAIANVEQMGCPEGYDPDRDSDGDGIPDISDNCPDIANSDQLDTDGDGIGDACDGCPELANEFADDVCATNVVNPTVNDVAPAIYMLVDASGSMGNQLDPNREKPWPMDEFKEAVASLPDDLLNTAHVGIGQYPFQEPPDTAATCTFEHLVDTGANQADTIRDAADGIEPWGDTPTGYALQQILAQNLLHDPNDPQNDLRPKIVVLVTDGDPTVACDSGAPINSRAEAQPEAVAGAEALADAGIPVYVVGFLSGADPANLDEIAAAGGTDAPDPTRRHFVAGNAQELVMALQSIRAETASCTLQLNNTTAEVDEMIVSIDGIEQIQDPTDGYSYDPAQSVLSFHGAACEEIKAADDPGAVEIEATLVDRGTAPLCEPTGPELCDYIDNDCDGEIDEGCPADDEVCDGVDNDLDGEIDEGCP